MLSGYGIFYIMVPVANQGQIQKFYLRSSGAEPSEAMGTGGLGAETIFEDLSTK